MNELQLYLQIPNNHYYLPRKIMGTISSISELSSPVDLEIKSAKTISVVIYINIIFTQLEKQFL